MKKTMLVIIGLIFLSIVTGSDVQVSQARLKEEEVYRNIELFIDALEVVRKQYVNDVQDQKLIYGALKGMLISLDPYSAFLEPAMKEELQLETKGEFQGVGMEITLKDGIITVVSPIEDTPAWNAGIKPGDKIVEINEESTKGFTTFEAAQKLRGKKGTEVSVSIMRTGLSEFKKFTLTRDVIKVKSVREKLLEDGLGYVRIRDFQERTASDLLNILQGMNEKDVRGLILDLRNNPGGLLSSSIEVSDMFLPKGKLIVYTQGREEKDRSTFYSRKKEIWGKPVVILINHGSASASEIVTGALKDNLSTVLTVGLKSFGKGSVQNLISLKDGSALKLTIAHYYTPSGVCIEGKGIGPDVNVEISEDKPVIPGEEGDVQFDKAIEELKKLVDNNE
ncbi:MAG TPA: S41 family peptidase [bacterium]|nr:S41 family peptidase [bacterium]